MPVFCLFWHFGEGVKNDLVWVNIWKPLIAGHLFLRYTKTGKCLFFETIPVELWPSFICLQTSFTRYYIGL
jgi:hypothetical protein